MAECAEPVTVGAGRVVIVEGTCLGHYALPPLLHARYDRLQSLPAVYDRGKQQGRRESLKPCSTPTCAMCTHPPRRSQ